MRGNVVNVRTRKSWYPTDETTLLAFWEYQAPGLANGNINGTLPSWSDTSHHNRTLHSEESNKPLYVSNSRSVNFDGVTQYLYLNETDIYEFTGATDFIMNFVISFAGDLTGQTFIGTSIEATENYISLIDAETIMMDFSGASVSIALSQPLESEILYNFTFVRNTDNVVTIYLDGTNIGAEINSAAFRFDSIGRRMEELDYLDGSIKEITLYGPLDDLTHQSSLVDRVIARGTTLKSL